MKWECEKCIHKSVCGEWEKQESMAACSYGDYFREDILGDDFDPERIKILVNQRMTMREEVAERFSITKNIPIGRLRDLVEAEREEKIITPPVKIGDRVYHITMCKDFPHVLDGTMYGADGGPGTATGLYCPCELAETCPFPCDDNGNFDCDDHKNILEIFEDKVTGIVIDEDQDLVTLEYSGSVDFEEFSKTVFLARETAEAALGIAERRLSDGEATHN